eukprot:CAMPEP_0185567472 /NCGR_PEP_ID=MMETSP0434-20130131/748_1 /TAXON_ID=626734 ORGANISM="Favella taraikaensis, Strain Fe Narragansett Bay" /NCGR_SAMPLE_ID=MMETSP0434 /ASSEMBLY_ACC=CAM_ASM_000379 /LENGTH=79 /DNA_ID=CAMNT_0028181721 /DNA_START=111 /DNA_END=350 /DNA_ORIENTATION=-
MAQSTLYQNQLRFQSTLLIPLNARLNLAISSELEDQEDTLITESDEVEDDTLDTSSTPRPRQNEYSEYPVNDSAKQTHG